MFRRIIGVFSANALGQVLNIILRLVSVPVFLKFWGSTVYGEWLILLTIPSYLALTGTGISAIAANEMAIRVSRSEQHIARAIFQSIWSFLLAISILFVLTCFVIAFTFPVAHMLGMSRIRGSSATAALVLLSIYTVFLLQGELLVGVFRASGVFAKGIFLNNLIGILEIVAVMIAAVCGWQILSAILLYVTVRIACTTIMALLALRQSSWFRFGFREARWTYVRSSLLPTVSYAGIHVSNALLVQGIVGVIALRLGPVSVVAFSVVRTVINLVKQLNGMVYYSVCAEFSTALAVGNRALARSLHRLSCQASMMFTLFNVAMLMIFGSYLLKIWTRGRADIDYPFFVLMLLAMLPNTFYVTSSYVQVSVNKMGKIAVLCLITSSLFLAISFFALPFFGLRIVPLLQLIFDAFLMLVIVRDSIVLVDDRVAEFFQSLFDFTSIRNLLNRRKLLQS